MYTIPFPAPTYPKSLAVGKLLLQLGGHDLLELPEGGLWCALPIEDVRLRRIPLLGTESLNGTHWYAIELICCGYRRDVEVQSAMRLDVKCFEDRLPCTQPAGTSEDRGGSNVAGEEFNDLESIILVLGATGKETLVPTEHLEREALSEAGTGAQV